ncbi:MAG TPA: endonuclease III [Bacillota bacterium]|jgi:endonuclease-3|nr:endonuclease III [Bacillota bacterium]HQD42001.1 endonuclease III [Bacillota bacterium]
MGQRNEEDIRRKTVLDILEKTYPDATTELVHKNPYELLIATMLSAQTTDKQVNKVTPGLFERFPDAKALAEADISEIESLIKTCGFYKSKARNIKEACRIIVEEYGGRVPQTMEELTDLPGVGRKTANVVLSNAFGVDAIAVDTHVFRVANRLGLAQSGDVRGTEEQLMENIPREKWSRAHHWLIHHGRRICKARRPKCEECPLAEVCSFKAEQ